MDFNSNFKTPAHRMIRTWILVFCMALIYAIPLHAQNISVKGVVSDGNTNEPLPGVNIIIKATQTGVVTDMDGNYQITVNSPDAVLMFSSVGYIAEEVAVRGRSVINILLVPDVETIDEVVVIGYGTVKRKDLTGSIATMSGEELERIPIANAAEAIKGRLPGVNVFSTDGSPDAEVVIRVRGGGSVTQDNSPLFVVDGFIVSSIR
ncbi:MAG TPA: carboxypeptidase-like regulatory domain-containing protein, partial [Bacteroidales bacterium]|nr:carboxypeptidase-like regulatory domain-containing protein [Bacteroidales bacterium]